MILNDSIFFSGRNSSSLRKYFDESLKSGQFNLLNLVQGEWNIFYYRNDLQKLICARDIFGRKSLCWRLVKDATEHCVLEVTAFPGIKEWYEIYPGTIFIFTLPKEAVLKTFSNKSILGILDLKCSNLSADFAESVQLQMHSHFSLQSLREDPFIKLFSHVQYTFIDAKNLLEPTPNVLSKVENEENLNTIADEFYLRFEAAVIGLGVQQLNYGSKIMVLFSGGVDSLLVALTAGNLVPPGIEIVLVNVAFGDTSQSCAAAPDRQRSINAFKFLFQRNVGQGKNEKCLFRLVLVNVAKKELVECRQKFIAKAISPSNSVLDDSIGCVLWFASRARGVEYFVNEQKSETVNFGNEVEFVLVGSGADEQLGGYARHRTVFKNFGYTRLADELAMEMARIGRRNFGRDDRIGTSNKRTILQVYSVSIKRAPFLEESFVEWLNTIPLSLKVDFTLPRGFGEKHLLRQALLKQGVPDDLAAQPKNAMQFGTRIAKLENRREKGSDVCNRLIGGIKLN